MNEKDPLHQLLIEFFNLAPETPAANLTHAAIPKWDSLATLQLMEELESRFKVEFGMDDVEHLASYAEIREVLLRKKVLL